MSSCLGGLPLWEALNGTLGLPKHPYIMAYWPGVSWPPRSQTLWKRIFQPLPSEWWLPATFCNMLVIVVQYITLYSVLEYRHGPVLITSRNRQLVNLFFVFITSTNRQLLNLFLSSSLVETDTGQTWCCPHPQRGWQPWPSHHWGESPQPGCWERLESWPFCFKYKT